MTAGVSGKATASAGRPLTGRAVLLMLLAFFAVVIAVNLVLAHAAISTFGGVATSSSYEAGLNFSAEAAAAAAQDALHWRVDGHLAETGASRRLIISAADANGTPLTHLAVNARFLHPADMRHDVIATMEETAPGTYSGTAAIGAGQWTLDLTIDRAGVRQFHSMNRIRAE
jgi:nitrogen fixation protein FixH